MQVNVDVMHQPVQTSLGLQGSGSQDRQTPVSIPFGYVMLPSGILLPVEALQGSQFAASLGMLPQPASRCVTLPEQSCSCSVMAMPAMRCIPLQFLSGFQQSSLCQLQLQTRSTTCKICPQQKSLCRVCSLRSCLS